MKKAILFLLVFATFACKKQERTSFTTPDCVQFEINGTYTKDCGVCLVGVVQYEFQNQDYYLKSYPRSDFSGLDNILVDNQCDTICIRTNDNDFSCGQYRNFFTEAKKIKTVFGD